VITKTEEHDTDRAGRRLLREVLEPLGVVNEVQMDYGIDYNVQVFDAQNPTGVWFHVQLKSSGSSDYSADRSFVSQELSIDHARHFAVEMRDAVLLIHADVSSKKVFWYAPQLDRRLTDTLATASTKSVTVRIPTGQELPGTAPDLLTALGRIRLVIAVRELTSAGLESFAESLTHLPNQAALFRDFQEKNDTLKLQNARSLFRDKKYAEARPRAETILGDPDSTIDTKFWAEILLRSIDYAETVRSERPQIELAKLQVVHARALRKLTAAGPKHLKFYSIIALHAAELDVLVHENLGVSMALKQHLEHFHNPMMALHLFVRRTALSRRIISKYNQCLRLARYASNFQDRWALGRALTEIVNAIGPYIITLHFDGDVAAERGFTQSALQVSKLAAWISAETGDLEGVALALLSSLVTVQSTDSATYKWAIQTAHGIGNPELREDTLNRIARAEKRWRGEPVDGDHRGDTLWQVTQNIATSLGLDITNENDPLVQGLRIAVRDNSPERVLATCEHIFISLGATGPTARRIRRLFNVATAGSKVVHCTLHDYHVEGKDQDSAFAEFKRAYCDSCPDKQPRPEGWKYTGDARRSLEASHLDLVRRLAGGPFGLRYTDED